MDLKEMLIKIIPQTKQEEEIHYTSVPLTLALRKRKFQEEQLKKYDLHKDKICDYE